MNPLLLRPRTDPGPSRTPPARRLHPRVALLALGGASLLAGLDAALLLVGVPAPVAAEHLPGVHGMVMVLGFLGTLISLERAQALRRPWAYLAPALLGAGGLALAAGLVPLGRLLLVDGALALVAVYVGLWRRAPLPLVAVQVLSAVVAAAAAALWLVVDVAALVPLLACFLVLTIASERAELAHLVLGRHATAVLVALAVWLTCAAASTLVWPDTGTRLFGVSAMATAGWLLRDDAPRRLIGTTTGLRRFSAAALLAGYGWLALAGAVWLVAGVPVGGRYDAVIHATFLGFGVSMVMAHAPIIFPAVLARPLPYRAVLWAPLVALHAGLAVRVAGDLTGLAAWWQAGSVGTVVALLAFVVTAAGLVVRG